MSRCRDRQALYLRALNPRAIQATASGELSAAGPITTAARVVAQSGGGPLITKSSHPPDRTSHKRKKPRRHLSFFMSLRSSLKAEGLAAVRASAEPGAAVLQPALLHLPRRLHNLPVQLRARRVSRAGRRRRQRALIPAAADARQLRPAHRGPRPLRARGRMPGVNDLAVLTRRRGE